MDSQQSGKTSWASAMLPKLLPWLLLLLGVVAYANSLGAGFVFDDRPHILRNPQLHQLWPISQHLLAQRGLVSLSLAINYAIEAREPRGYHLVNVLIHLLGGLALYGLARRTLLVERLQATFGAAAPYLAAVIAALWIVHPLQTESVTYIIQRAEAMAGLFFIVMLYGLVRHHQATSSWSRAGWTLVMLGSYVAALLSKESAAVAPLVAILYDRCLLGGSFKAALQQRRWLYGTLGVWIGLAMAWVFWTLQHAESAGFNVPNTTPLTYLASQPPVIVQYLKLVVWPHPLVLDYLWQPVTRIEQHLPHTVLLVTLGVLTLWALWRNRPIGVMGAWFFITLGPTSSFVPILDLYFEHRMYVPLAAVLAVLVLGGYLLLRRVAPPRAQVAVGAAAALAVIFALTMVTIDRNFDYYDELSLWKSVVDARPRNARAHVNYGAALYDVANRPFDALNHYRIALKLSPRYTDAYANIGSVYLNMGKLDEAEQAYTLAYRLEPDSATLVRNLGKLAIRRGKFDEAERWLRQSIGLEPQFGPTYDDLGYVLLQMDRLEEAEQALQSATSLAPQFVYGWMNLAELRLRQGRRQEASAAARKAAAVVPADPRLINTIGSILARAGQHEESLAQFKQALALDPKFTVAIGNLAGALLMLDRPAEGMVFYRQALALNNQDHAMVRRVAWVLATHPDESIRNGEEALQMAAWANQQTRGQSPLYLQTLAAALANLGRFDEAVAVQQKAIDLATKAKTGVDLDDYHRPLTLYQQSQPYRIAPSHAQESQQAER